MRFAKKMLPWCCVIIGVAMVGCNDPYSQRRIQRRLDAQHEFVADCNKQEELRAIRLREEGETVKRWHEQRVKRWKEISPTVGDYLY